MRTTGLGSSPSGAVPHRRRDERRTAQPRTVRFPVTSPRRGLTRRGAR
ncbi:hypothetical protein ACIBL3_25295 [Kribbella sp. NPDC050124]